LLAARPRGLALGLLALTACGGARPHRAPVVADPDQLHVEIRAGDSRTSALRAGAAEGLAKVRFAALVEEGGEIELQVDVSQLEVQGNHTVCKVTVLVLRLPAHAMLGVAEGTARAGGTNDDAGDACVERLAFTLIRGKVRPLLKRQLRARR
jgi:hypothetical protein